MHVKGPWLSSQQVAALVTAVTFMTAGEAGGVPDRVVEAARSAADTFFLAGRRAKWVMFSQKELELLWLVLGNGAPETGNTLGMSVPERRAFAAAANRIADAAGLAGERF